MKCPLDVPHANSERLLWLRLVVELGVGQHHDPAGLARDRLRAAHLERQGLEVLRFSNLDVLQNLDGVLTELLRRIEARAPHPSPLPNEERGLSEATEPFLVGPTRIKALRPTPGTKTARAISPSLPGRGLG